MISFPEILLRLAVALMLGAVVGFEREQKEHAAGMRTLALVSLGCALFTIISAYGFLELLTIPHTTIDPTRIASHIVAGIGFLGGGTIFLSRQSEKVKGLTTAATIWVIAAVGIAYGKPPLNAYHEGGIFTTRTIPRASADETALKELNRQIISAFGLVRGVTHTEFIKGHHDGQFYFLETAARVGGANIAEMVEASTSINLWREWAKIELNSQNAIYQLPEQQQNYAGVIVSLARQEHPDTSAYQDPEIVMRFDKRHHVGFVIASDSPDRVNFLLDEYTQRFANDFLATLPPSETRPPSNTSE